MSATSFLIVIKYEEFFFLVVLVNVSSFVNDISLLF